MDWEELRDRCVLAMGEVDSQAAAAAGAATFSRGIIDSRLEETYRTLVSKCARLAPNKFAASQTFTYAAEAESINLDAKTEPSLRHRKLIRLEDYTETDYPRPIRIGTEQQMRTWQEDRIHDDQESADDYRYMAYFQAERMYIVPKPNADRTIRAVYIPTIKKIPAHPNQNTGSPELLPEEHHSVIAVGAAISLLPEGPPMHLLREFDRLERELYRWVAEDKQAGPRYVHGVY